VPLNIFVETLIHFGGDSLINRKLKRSTFETDISTSNKSQIYGRDDKYLLGCCSVIIRAVFDDFPVGNF